MPQKIFSKQTKLSLSTQVLADNKVQFDYEQNLKLVFVLFQKKLHTYGLTDKHAVSFLEFIGKSEKCVLGRQR